MKQTVITVSKAVAKNNAIEWVDETEKTVCASTKSVNSLCEELREQHCLISKVETMDFYFDEEKTKAAIKNMVKAENVPSEFEKATIAHIFEAMRKACCFIPESKK